MSGRALLVVLGLCAGCDPVVERIELDFQLGAGCEDELAAVLAISIEGIAENGACKNTHGCVPPPVMATTLEQLEAEIRDAESENGPLIEVDLDRTQQIAVNGRPCFSCFPADGGSCDNTPILCGVANLDAVEDGVLLVPLGCAQCVENLALCEP